MTRSSALRLTPKPEPRSSDLVELPAPCAECAQLICLCGGTLEMPRQQRSPWTPVLLVAAGLATLAAGAADGRDLVIYWPAVGGIGALVISAVNLYWLVKRAPTQVAKERRDFKQEKEDSADRLAIRTYDWYDGSFTSSLKMVEWLREQVQLEQKQRKEEVKVEREARLLAEIECEKRIERIQSLSDTRIAQLHDEIDRLRAGFTN